MMKEVHLYTTNIGNVECCEKILIVKKEINIIFEDVNEEQYIKYYYNKKDKFKNIKYETNIDPNNIYFQFYYKPAEYRIAGTISNRIINGLKSYCNINDVNRYNQKDDI